jgi:hypothetical protein
MYKGYAWGQQGVQCVPRPVRDSAVEFIEVRVLEASGVR